MSDVNISACYGAALKYIARSWAVIPVHGIADNDRCTCGAYPCGKDNENAGKHPVRRGWQTGEAFSRADAYVWEENPRWNIGIRTGDPSGVFVLDIDPKSDGLAELGRLIEQHGPLPHTYTVRTGSGGRHYYFRMPGFPVRNSSKRIGAGIDIRGTGGMVVAPPSTSGIGSYTVIEDAPVADAPAWLLEAVRPTTPGDVGGGAVIVVEDLPTHGDLERLDAERVQSYAREVIEREASAYRTAAPGNGNATLYAAACNGIEIAQSPWNLCTVADVHEILRDANEARARELPGRGQTPEEFEKTFASARTHVVGQGRALPEDRSDGVMFDPGDDYLPEVKPEIIDFNKPRLSGRERIFDLLKSRSELDSIPPPTPLIKDVIDVGTVSILAGQFGTYKTFAAVGWACSIATGKPWLGHEVPNPGPVLYVAAEGASGLRQRVTAWENRFNDGVRIGDDRLKVIPAMVDIGNNQECGALLEIILKYEARLIIIDTLHRCTPGMEENSNTDMARAFTVAGVFRERGNECATLYVHHAGHGGDRTRGASCLMTDPDGIWISRLTGPSDSRDARSIERPRRFEQVKTKDSPLIDPFYIGLKLEPKSESATLAMLDEDGAEIDTGATASPFTQPRKLDTDAIRERCETATSEGAGLILNIFLDVFNEHASGVTEAKVKQIAKVRYAERTGWGGKSFSTSWGRAWGRLQNEGIIEESGGGRWQVVPASERVSKTKGNNVNDHKDD